MNNEKDHQRKIAFWLKKQSIVSRYWMNISQYLGCINGCLIVLQSWIISSILHSLIIETISKKGLLLSLFTLVLSSILRSWILYIREKIGCRIGQNLRHEIRKKILDKLQQSGPIFIQSEPIGSWSTLILEQIEDIHDYYARYLPQKMLAVCIPLMIIVILFLINWVIASILLCSIPIVLISIVVIGIGASEANRRNFLSLSRLSSYFLDRLIGMETIRLFNREDAEIENIRRASQDFRIRTMEVLRLAFLSSSVLELFISISIILITFYFGFSYLKKFNFGYSGTEIALSTALFSLILSQEFFQPLRDLSLFYHAKKKAIGAADRLKIFLETPLIYQRHGKIVLNTSGPYHIVAENLSVLSPKGEILSSPINFIILEGQRVSIVGKSGSGKSLLINVFAGFLPYTGSLRINGIEFCSLKLENWQKTLSLVGQNPQLLSDTLRKNILIAFPNASEIKLNEVLNCSLVSEFLHLLPKGVDSFVGNHGENLSIGQIQRVAIARALIKPCNLLLLDEPTANLDVNSEKRIMNTLNNVSRTQTTLMITHNLEGISEWDQIWVMENGQIVEQGNYETLCKLRNFTFLNKNSW